MNLKRFKKLSSVIYEAKCFFAPRRIKDYPNKRLFSTKNIAILIPTYKPGIETFSLIKSIIKLYPQIFIVIIDDCTPIMGNYIEKIADIKSFASSHDKFIYLRTPTNMLKAGALNFGIKYLMKNAEQLDVVFTFDDDVIINKHTLPFMVSALYSEKKIGAVCSQVKILNKNKNILTRLQGLEYHNFNITKIADNGFLKGPLVMQGMMTAMRVKALKKVRGYSRGHLIEDYDITVRLKDKGWRVKITQKAFAWTTIPETIEDLWKQRARWISGGLYVLSEYWRKPSIVYQDLIGHFLFLSLILLVILSFIFTSRHDENSIMALILLGVASLNFIVSFIFNIITIRMYSQRDRIDWLIKLSILPEFIYSNFLSLILLGSYIFFIYNFFAKHLIAKFKLLERSHRIILSVFNKFGFSKTWGTR